MARTFSAGTSFMATRVIEPESVFVVCNTIFLKPARETLRANSFAFSFELKAPSWMSQKVPGVSFTDFLVLEVFGFDEFALTDDPPSFAIILLAEAAVC